MHFERYLFVGQCNAVSVCARAWDTSLGVAMRVTGCRVEGLVSSVSSNEVRSNISLRVFQLIFRIVSG